MAFRTQLLAMWDAAVAAALPDGKFAGVLPDRPKGRTLVLGGGKAAARMAAAFEDAWGPCDGLVVTRYGHGYPTRFVEVLEAGHPVPDEAGVEATRRIVRIAREAGPDDLVVFLISGGASALVVEPIEGLTLEDKQDVNRELLRSGMPIDVMNAVRRSISAVKGGRLAAFASPARIVTYVISDVPGDRPQIVGSGPTTPVVTDPRHVGALLRGYGVVLRPKVAAAIERIEAGVQARTPAPAPDTVHVLATPLMALRAAAAAAERAGLFPVILGDALEGEARDLGTVLAGVARSCAMHGHPVSPPCVLLSGGEATVTVLGRGRGGRNTEFLLGLLNATGGLDGRVAAIACDTDGIDGMEDNAGALFDDDTRRRAKDLDLRPMAFLSDNDAYSFFAATGDLVVRGPTYTNVNDFRAIIVQ